ncbi:phospholipid-translocating P-type ATPase, flippase family protein [Tritrichomonas foetus]|uniref:Phospholipid-transporting ATPase n=1 Tax=Tritrichomonas foetus TaxID=1144522 RepID=A0A1J4KRA6_9EUKA|nr:phospholipid-translocating P-type ATPase, flippase family protein [Tritrichomonas foetus]|eukprot:OHT13626.1 phospholipid-translocating P-type ATPase, flippase family protein [Tritrichomonas foetus]
MRLPFHCKCCEKIEMEDRIIKSNSYEESKKYGHNKVVNSKYTVFTFLPLILIAHLCRFMNLYFIIIGCLQLWKDVSPVNPLTTWAPIVIIFAIAFIREGIDDYQQHQQDKALNTRMYEIIRDKKKLTIESQEITVGDIVILKRDEEAPCDMAILHSSDDLGRAFIETANLDGETNLKEIIAPKDIQELGESGLQDHKIIIRCQPPTPEIYSFNSYAHIDHERSNRISMSKEQFIQCGVFLRNIKYIYGLACYTGNQTKLGLNSNQPPIKWTQIEKFLDKCSLLLFCCQILLAIVYGSIANWQKGILRESEPYLRLDITKGTQSIIYYVRCYLLTSIMIPISLKVTLDICKYIYAVWIRNDVQMYDYRTKTRTLVNNTSVIEDLGAIEYIFSDKTGTMTENEMFLKKLGLEKGFFGHSSDAVDIYEDKSFGEILNTLEEANKRERDGILYFIYNLCLCHTVKIIQTESGKVAFEGMSAEEVSFLTGMDKLGILLSLDEDEDTITIESPKLNIPKETFKIVDVLPFSYERKRMSVVARQESTGLYFLFSKGAHEMIMNNCGNIYEGFLEQVDTFSYLGLRVMAMSTKQITEDEYKKFSSDLNRAKTEDDLANREEAVNTVYTEFEEGQILLGCTGIEDKLQDGVPQTISMLRDAGIHVWMVTGDVQGTAIKIARTTRLITNEEDLIDISDDSKGMKADEILKLLKKHAKRSSKPFDLVLRGDSPLTPEYLGKYKKKFAKIASLAKCVICARTTPLQKSLYVEAIQSLKKVTMAVGDGGNDVVMLRTAHIGIGIMGKEGRQASIASDFAISRFSSLQRLLLIHGRFSFYRTAWLTQFCFYKSIMLALIQVGFMFWNGFSGASFVNDFNLMCYNAIFTVLPVIFFLFDKDVEEETVFLHPYIYSDSRCRTYCNPRSMFWWIMRAIYHAAVVVIVINFSLTGNSVNGVDGSPMGLDEVQQVAYSTCILNVLFTVVFDTQQFTSLNFIFIWGNWFLYVLFTIFANLIADFSMTRDAYLVCWRVYSNPYDWIVSITATTISVMPIVFIQSLFSTFLPTNAQQLRYNEVTTQSRYQPTYLVNADEGTKDYQRLKSADSLTVWDESHNLCTPFCTLCGCVK